MKKTSKLTELRKFSTAIKEARRDVLRYIIATDVLRDPNITRSSDPEKEDVVLINFSGLSDRDIYKIEILSGYEISAPVVGDDAECFRAVTFGKALSGKHRTEACEVAVKILEKHDIDCMVLRRHPSNII